VQCAAGCASVFATQQKKLTSYGNKKNLPATARLAARMAAQLAAQLTAQPM